MAASFRLKILGPPELLDGRGRPVALRTKKQLALLIYLHCEARAHPAARDELVDLLWSDASADKGRHSLSQALTAIRDRLGAQALQSRSDAVTMVAPLVTELDSIGADGGLVEIAQPLKDLDKCAGADFAHWVDAARERILRDVREGLAVGLREARSRGDLARVHRTAVLLNRLDPVNPSAVVALAERALLDGDTIGAMRILREYLRRVEQELGANPHPEITGLLRRLERGDGPALDASGPLTSIARPRREMFVGREQELAQLEAWWQRGREVPCLTALVTGVAGIGKSSLVRRFATSVAARTSPVFVVTCQEIGSGIPFAAVSDLILAIARDPGASGTDPLWLAEASRVSPGLRAAYPGIPEPPQAPAESVRLRVAEALVRMIESVAEQSAALIAFDDVQHMDPASRDVLFLFTRRLERLRVVLMGSLRTVDAQRPPVPETETLGWQEALELAPLAEGHVKELIAGLSEDVTAPDDRIRTTIAGLAQGNPYHVEMLLSDWRQHASASLVVAESAGDGTSAAWKPPETLRLTFARQYKGLSADAQHVLHVLAVAGKALPTVEIAALLRLDPPVVEHSVLELVDRGLVRVDGGQFYFKNELHRAFVYYAMSDDMRKYQHGRLGQLLAGDDSAIEFQRLAEASHHFIKAKMERDATSAAVLAAELAVARGAPREAERVLDSLLAAYPAQDDARVFLVFAEALVAEGQHSAALEALEKWRPKSATRRERALAALVKADACQRGRLVDDASVSQAAAEAVELAKGANDEATLVRALQIQAEAASEAGDLGVLMTIGTATAEAARRTSSPECRALAALTTGFTALVQGDLNLAAETFNDSAPLLSDLSLQAECRRALNGLGIAATGLGRFQAAIEAFQRGIEVAAKLGNPIAVSNTWSNLASLYQDIGAFADAARCFREAMKAVGSRPVSRVRSELFTGAGKLAIVLGSLSEAERMAECCLEASRQSGLWRFRTTALLMRADLHLAREEPEFAWPLVEQTVAEVAGRSFLLPEAGQFGRLYLHWLWATRGREAMLSGAKALPRFGTYARITESLEVVLFEEALGLGAESRDTREPPALQRLLELGVYGVIARLTASGVYHPAIERPSRGETSAQLIARLFPSQARAVVPSAVGLLEPDGGSQHPV